MKIEIKSRFDGRVLFAGEYASLKDAVIAAANIRANLSGADLSGAILSRADLSGANLSRADLSGADLSGADLSGANLSRADLSGANLYRADLSCANLSYANLSGANLSGADLSGAILGDGAKCVAGSAVVQVGPIGSRGATMVVFKTDKGLRVQTGCFFGDADTFLAQVMSTHGTNDHATNYRNALELAASMMKADR